VKCDRGTGYYLWFRSINSLLRKGRAVLTEGDKLAKLTLLDDEGNKVSTHSLLGGHLVLYFYPKDDTPGCTNEGTQFRDLYDAFKKKGTQVVGVSRDSVDSHRKFKEKFDFPFPLLADTDSKLCDAFGVIVEKNMYGKKSMGVARSTFLIDPDGKIVKVWPKVKVEGHAAEVLSSLP
jgi:thioredoxin-dependent peroxiredoxin